MNALKPVENLIKEIVFNTNNEVIIKIDKENIRAVSKFLFRELDCDLVSIVATDESDYFILRYIFSYPKDDYFFIVEVDTKDCVESITVDVPAANWFEREIIDLFGVDFIGHPDKRPLVLFPENFPPNLHPLRKNYNASYRPEFKEYGKYEYKEVEGEGVFNILVGPIHAGIIEPGHFRFSLAGEHILQLEIRHFWKHRGIEKILEGKTLTQTMEIVDKISGDHAVAHTLAYVQAVEKILNIEIPQRAKYIRVILAELERLMCNINDMAWLFQDVAYSFGAQGMFILKEEIMRLNKSLTGNRFLKGSLTIGGVNTDLDKDKIEFLTSKMAYIKENYNFYKKIITTSASILDRFETTGRIKYETVKDLSCSGYTARASGRKSDVRKNHPYLVYKDIKFSSQTFDEGDCFARLKCRMSDIEDSFYIIEKMIIEMPDGELKVEVDSFEKEATAIGYCEGQRGAVYHVLKTNKEGKIDRIKITDPSYNNWQTIQFAVLGDIVADFPLVNKSLNLSYAGTDL